jgi:hypothetical protein
VSCYICANAILLAFQVEVPALRRYLFAILIIGVLVIERRTRAALKSTMDTRHLKHATIALAIGFGVWLLDITKVACSPSSLFQGHALWHVAGALASYCLFAYYASEVVAKEVKPTGI